MKRKFSNKTLRWRSDRGQTTIFVVIAMAMFLLGFVGFAVDMTNLWFHRQMAQGAADASCQAAVMNVLVPTATQGFTVGTSFNCSGSPGATPCEYATLNGYNGTGLVANTPSNSVVVNFPLTVTPGIDPAQLPPGTLVPFPYLQVVVTDRVQQTFSPLITGRATADVQAAATCGITLSKAPVPIIVLNPTCTHPFEVSGSATLKIVGGPTRSVQVNSFNQTCAAATAPSGCTGNANIDLSQGGPNFTGSQFGTFGAPGTASPGFQAGTTGSWANTSPISDPFITTPPPNLPALAPAPTMVAYGAFGCPDQTGANGTPCGNIRATLGSGCCRYQPGLYNAAIVVKGHTAIFDPGVYYIRPASNAFDAANCGSPGNGCTSGPSGGQCRYGFSVDSNGVVRPSNVTGNGNGTMFYMSGTGAGANPYGGVFFGANAGNTGGRTVDNYVSANASCDGTPPDPRVGMPATVPGNILLGQCTGGGTYLGAPSTDVAGNNRGLLFFGDRNNGTNGTYQNGFPSMSGGGGLLLSGSLYFTNCPGWPAPCSPPPAGYNAFLEIRGNPGSGTYVLGNITVDQLIEAGNGSIAMQLNPNAIYNILKATLVQ